MGGGNTPDLTFLGLTLDSCIGGSTIWVGQEGGLRGHTDIRKYEFLQQKNFLKMA